MDGAHGYELHAAARNAGLTHKITCVWAKTNAGMGSFYRHQVEFVHVFKCGTGAHVNNIELGRHGRYRTTLWTYAGVNTFRKGRGGQSLGFYEVRRALPKLRSACAAKGRNTRAAIGRAPGAGALRDG
jgi:hypothetical protein